jgi:iron complex transport system ATP-binding protein
MTLVISNLTVRRGAHMVLRDLTLTLQPGAVTVLIGPNGSGKSTLLAALSGALPYEGSIRLMDKEVRQTAPDTLAKDRALMSQQADVSFAFPVAEIVAMGALRPQGPARIAALLAEVGLAGFGARNAMELSGGEAQRMHLARALAQAETGRAPFWLMLDEPVSSLDLSHQIAVMDRARAFAKAGGGVLLVLHDLNLAVRGADRIIVLHKGAITADGAPAAVLTDALLKQVYDCALPVNRVPHSAPFLLVQSGVGEGFGA